MNAATGATNMKWRYRFLMGAQTRLPPFWPRPWYGEEKLNNEIYMDW